MFKCHTCNKVYQNKGICCGKALESACPSCGLDKDRCICETTSTKEGLKR